MHIDLFQAVSGGGGGVAQVSCLSCFFLWFYIGVSTYYCSQDPYQILILSLFFSYFHIFLTPPALIPSQIGGLLCRPLETLSLEAGS